MPSTSCVFARRPTRRMFHDEATLGAGGHDDGVLHHLRLHQPEDLGPEVLHPVRPAQPASGDLAEAQVHALDPGRVDEDLELRPGQRQHADRLRVELQADVRLAPAVRRSGSSWSAASPGSSPGRPAGSGPRPARRPRRGRPGSPRAARRTGRSGPRRPRRGSSLASNRRTSSRASRTLPISTRSM